MKNKEILARLRQESEVHTPRVAVDPHAASADRTDGTVVAVASRSRRLPLIALAACGLALLLLLALLLPALNVGRSDLATLVISINPSAEFTLEGGKVTKTRALNRDAAVLLVGQDFSSLTAEQACVSFAQLASERKLIGPDGIRIHVTGRRGSEIASGVAGALQQYATVGDLDAVTLDGLLGGYDEQRMGDFESYVERAYAGKREQILMDAKTLLATYADELSALSPSDMGTISAFNEKYMLLGEDFLAEADDDWDEEVRERIEEANELLSLIDRNPDRAFEELFEGFLELLEEEYDREEQGDDDDDDEDEDDDDDDDEDDDD